MTHVSVWCLSIGCLLATVSSVSAQDLIIERDSAGTVIDSSVESSPPSETVSPPEANEPPAEIIQSEPVAAESGAKETDLPAEATIRLSEPVQRHSGIGMNFGLFRIFNNGPLNSMLEDLYNDMKEDIPPTAMIISETGFPSMVMTFPILRMKYLYYPIPYLGIAPYGQYVMGIKLFKLWDEETIMTNDLYGGVDVWFRIAPRRGSFKLGVGGFGGYTSISATGDKGDVFISGYMAGGNFLLGLDIITRRITVNLDFGFPMEYISYTSREGEFNTTNPGSINWSNPSNYPDRVFFIGFEFKPGITINF